MTKTFGGVRNSSPAVAGSPFGSANRRIYGSLSLAQICSVYAPQTSHILRTLYDMAGEVMYEEV